MKFIGIRDLRNQSSRIFKDLESDQEVIITSNGKPRAILFSVSENGLEDQLTAIRRAKAVMAVSSLQKESVRKGMDSITKEAINAEIKAVRRKNRS
jgi:prevent-host-death family protein